MIFVFDPLIFVNFILCSIILALGYATYWRSGDEKAIYIGMAFGIFAVSHLAMLLGLNEPLVPFLIFIRTIAYILVVIALYKFWRDVRSGPPRGGVPTASVRNKPVSFPDSLPLTR